MTLAWSWVSRDRTPLS